MTGATVHALQPPAVDEEPDGVRNYRDAVRALGEVAEAITDEQLELDDLLHLVAERICQLSGVRRCGLYLRDERGDLFRGRVGHSDRDIDAGIRRLVAGIPADRFTQEIVETKRPVFARNAREDPRTVRATMREWQVRSILGVPMLLRGSVEGIIFLDDLDRAHEFTEAEQELSAAFANLAAAAIAQTKLMCELRASIETTARQNGALRRAAVLEERLTALVLDGANLRQIAQGVSDLTTRPCAVHDATNARRAMGVPAGGRPDLTPGVLDPQHAAEPQVIDALAALRGKRVAVIGPFPSLAMPHRYLLAPVVARGEHWGYLILTEHGSRFGATDMLIARRAATIVALEMTAESRAVHAESDVGESLLSELVRGNCDHRSLERRAEFLGVELARPHVLVLVSPRPGHASRVPSARDVAATAREILGDDELLATGVAEGVVVMATIDTSCAPRDALNTIERGMTELCDCLLPDGALAAAISTVCRDPADFAGAYAEVRELTGVIEGLEVGNGHTVLAVDDLGAGRMLMVGVDGRSADRYVRDVLGPLFDPETPRGSDLLVTLRTFIESSRSIRRCAERLEVHENTVRYRLARVEELLGLKVATDADDQLSVQMALLVASLRGCLEDAADAA